MIMTFRVSRGLTKRTDWWFYTAPQHQEISWTATSFGNLRIISQSLHLAQTVLWPNTYKPINIFTTSAAKPKKTCWHASLIIFCMRENIIEQMRLYYFVFSESVCLMSSCYSCLCGGGSSARHPMVGTVKFFLIWPWSNTTTTGWY